MSNHAYVFAKTLPPAEQINKDAQEIVNRKFPQFELIYTPRNNKNHTDCWELKHRSEVGRPSLSFWLDRHTPKGKRVAQPCIEFSHPRGDSFMWWVEYEIREELATRYSAMTDDDGLEGPEPPSAERFNTYAEYLLHIYNIGKPGVPDFRPLVKNDLAFARKRLPPDLKPLIGEYRESACAS